MTTYEAKSETEAREIRAHNPEASVVVRNAAGEWIATFGPAPKAPPAPRASHSYLAGPGYVIS